MTFPSRSAAVALGLLLAGALSAADIPKPPTEISRARASVYSMRNGSIRVKDDPKNRENLRTVAQWIAFSLDQPPYNGDPLPANAPKLPTGFDTISYLMSELENFTVREGGTLPAGAGTGGKPSQEQLEYSDEFGKVLADAVKVVLDNATRPVERINAVRMLSIGARLPAPSLADALVAVVNGKGTDAEKLYAFQGLRNLLDQSDINDPTRSIFPGTLGTAKLAEIGTALNGYVFQKRTWKDDREKAVIEFVRREAVAALARFKDGVLRKPNRELLFRPAWAVARVMEADPSAAPPFTVHERTEAATGLGQMRIDPDMNLDVAAYSQAKMLIIFARDANVDGGRAAATGTLPVMHWRVAAARWSYNLAVWRENLKALPAARGAAPAIQIADLGIALLTTVEKGGAGAANGPEVQAVNQWGTNNPPKAWASKQDALLFKDDPQSILPFPVAPTPDPALKTPDPKKGATPDPKKAPDPKKGTTPKKP
jgi:hypothetical protein